MKNPIRAVAGAIRDAFTAPVVVGDASDIYRKDCAEKMATTRGARALEEHLLALSKTDTTRSYRKRTLIRRQLAVAKEMRERGELQAEIDRCAAARRAAGDECRSEEARLLSELGVAEELVAQQAAVLAQREERAAPVMAAAQRSLSDGLAAARLQTEQAQAALERAERASDDEAARAAANRLVEAQHAEHFQQSTQTPELLRAGVLERHVAEARQALQEAEAAATAVRGQLQIYKLKAALLDSDEASTKMMLASAAVLAAVMAAPKEARLPPFWRIPFITVADPAHVPGARGVIDGFTPSLPARCVERLVACFGRTVDLSSFEVDPATLPDDDDQVAPQQAERAAAA